MNGQTHGLGSATCPGAGHCECGQRVSPDPGQPQPPPLQPRLQIVTSPKHLSEGEA